jgi:hypothetical protein
MFIVISFLFLLCLCCILLHYKQVLSYFYIYCIKVCFHFHISFYFILIFTYSLTPQSIHQAPHPFYIPINNAQLSNFTASIIQRYCPATHRNHYCVFQPSYLNSILAADIPSSILKPCPGHIATTSISLLPALSPHYSHHPCLYNAPYVSMQVLLVDCLALKVKAL